MNRILLRGNLGSDLEEKVSPKGNYFAKFSVAENLGADKAAEWYNCICFDKHLIEFDKERLVKGSNIELWGVLKTDRTDKGTYHSVQVKDIVSVYAKQGAGGSSNAAPKVRAGGVKAVAAPVEEDEDAPF